MKILVFVPTLNAAKLFKNLLNVLKKQTIVNIFIIDSSSTDNTVQIAKTAGVEVHEIPRSDFNHATTRNLALQKDADFYLFMTQDALPYDDKLVENLFKPFDDENVVVSYARQIPYKDANEIEKFARETNYPATSIIKSKDSIKELGIKTFFSSNSCAMYRADYFKKVGGFKEGLIMNEDMEFAYRAIMDDKKVAYCSDAKVWHSHNYSSRDIFKRYFDIGVFFKTNQYILDQANTESTGIKQAIEELKYLSKKNGLLLPKSFIFSFVKFIAYKMGFNYKKIPYKLRKTLSLHKNWHKK